MQLAIFILAVLALAAGAVHAADKPKAGFDALDKNNDGFIARAEAAGSARLLKGFDVADKNDDGKLNRAEYLSEMTKKDLRTGKAKVEHGMDKPASSGSSR